MRRDERRSERGVVAVLVALLIFVLGAFLALALNVGLIMHTRTELQGAADSAALAAAAELDGTANGLSTASTLAPRYTGAHLVTRAPVTLGAGDVEFGRWHFKAEGGWAANTFEPLAASQAFVINAVRVTDGRDGASGRNSALPVFFSRFLGIGSVSVNSYAVAVGPGARTDCPMPFVFPLCAFQDGSGYRCGQDVTLTLAPAGSDNIGFIFLNGQSGTTGVVSNIIGRCANDGYAGIYSVQNGNNLNDQVIQALLGVTTQGQNVNPIPPLREDGSSALCIFNPGNDSFPIADVGCPPNFTGTTTVGRFGQVLIRRIVDNNGNIYCGCPRGGERWNNLPQYVLCGTGGGGRSLTVNLSCDGDGGMRASASSRLRLVQ